MSKRYLIWSQGDALDYPRLYDGESKFYSNHDREWNPGSSGMVPGEIAFVFKNGRFVTLDHQPTPSEVRELLAMPDPLEECFALLERVANPNFFGDPTPKGLAEVRTLARTLLNTHRRTA